MKWVVVALALVSHSAAADDFALLRFATGASLPLADEAWKSHTKAGPLLDAYAGYEHEHLAGLVSASVTDLSIVRDPAVAAFASNDAAFRLRFLAHVAYDQRVGSKLTLELRAGAGIDVTFASYDASMFGSTEHRSENEKGLALEGGAGGWFDIGIGLQLGGEVAVPVAFHSTYIDAFGPLGFTYKSTDLELMLGVRITSLRD